MYLFSVLFLVGVSSFLPSGFIFGFPLKHLIFLSSIFLLATIAINYNYKISYSIKVKVYILLAIILLVYLFYSVFQDTEISYVFEDFKFIFTTFLFFVSIELSKYFNNLTYTSLYKSVFLWAYYGIFLFCISKTILVFALLFNYIDYSYVTSVIFPVINYEPVGLNIPLIGSRFSFVTLDMLSVIVFLLIIYFDGFKIKKIHLYLFYIFFLISLFSAYSRYLFFITPVLFILIQLMKARYKFIFYFLFFILVIVVFNFDVIKEIFENRFLNQEHSDIHRETMIHNLTLYWEENLIFGHGYGAYVPYYIRDMTVPFSYEVQFLSLIMRFGVIFLLFIVSIELMLTFYLIKLKSKEIMFAIFLFNVIMVASLTNQYLFNSTTNISLILIYLLVMSTIERGKIHANN